MAKMFIKTYSFDLVNAFVNKNRSPLGGEAIRDLCYAVFGRILAGHLAGADTV